jgi:uncharacterized protein YjlB
MNVAIIQGSSRLVLGRPKPLDGQETSTSGLEIDVTTGDVVVVPAGVSHRSLTSEGGYRYIGVYPKVRRSPDLLILCSCICVFVKLR